MTNPPNHQMHYIPKMYLKTFADTKGYVNIEDLNRNSSYRAHIKTVCRRHEYYTIPESLLKKGAKHQPMLIDQCLSDIENKTAYYLNKTQWRSDPADEQMVSVLKDFVASMLVRTPVFRDSINNNITRVVGMHNTMLGLPEYEFKVVKNTELPLMLNLASFMRDHLSNFGYSFWFSEKPKLTTTDNPVIREFEGMTLRLILLPLTPNDLIILDVFGFGYQGTHKLPSDMVDNINLSLRMNSRLIITKGS